MESLSITWYWATATSIPGTTWRSIYLDRGDLAHATELYERWTERVVVTAAPDPIKGIVLYNLACFYATHGQLEKAAADAAGGATARAPAARSGPGAILTWRRSGRSRSPRSIADGKATSSGW